MATLFYGNGEVTIEGSNIRGAEINYKGIVEISKTCGEGVQIAANENKIMIFPLGEGFLSNLFKYKGELKILSVIIAGEDGEKVSTKIKQVMDFAELLGDSESITINSEDLKSDYVIGNRPQKTIIKKKYITENTKNISSDLIMDDGYGYNGDFHIDPSTNIIKTGSKETLNSKELKRKNFRNKGKSKIKRSSY